MADKKVLVMGGGAAGIQAALSEAAAGNKVYLAEHFPSVGGERIPQDRIIADGDAFTVPDVAAIKKNENIEFLSNADVQRNAMIAANVSRYARSICTMTTMRA